MEISIKLSKTRIGKRYLQMFVIAMLLPTMMINAQTVKIPDGWSDGYAYVNGIRIHFYHAKPAPGKPVIVMVHGFTDIGLNWTTSTKLSDNWSLTSRLGINRTWSTVRYRYETGDSNYQRTAMTAGVGLAYKLTPHVSLTVDVTYMPIRITPDIEKTAPILGTGLRYDF